MAIDVLLGLQWGDEGKGKIVDYLAPQYDMICRFQGGPNAGHSLHFDDHKFVLHTIPSGIFRDDIINLIGNGTVIDPCTLQDEIQEILDFGIDVYGRLLLSHKAQLILPTHKLLDKASELSKGKDKIGSTLKGIGPTYMDKTGRNGLRCGDILLPDFIASYERLRDKHMRLMRLYPEVVDFDLESEEQKWFAAIDAIKKVPIVNGEYYVNNAISQGKKLLAEGAQGSMLDIDYGTYPYVTSSNTLASGVCSGLGVAPKTIRKVIGITKAYCTRVGSGPFPTELFDSTGSYLQEKGAEFGATTGRARRCGWLDLVQLNYSIMLNGVDEIVLTKLDVMSEIDVIKYADSYSLGTDRSEKTSEFPYSVDGNLIEPQYATTKGWSKDLTNTRSFGDLPHEATTFISSIEKITNTPIRYISVGPDREQLIVR